MKEIYAAQKDVLRLVDGLDDEEVLAVAKKLAGGVHMSSSVFDGAHESEISILSGISGNARHRPDHPF